MTDKIWTGTPLEETNALLEEENRLLRAVVALVRGPERASAALHRHKYVRDRAVEVHFEDCPGCKLDAALAELKTFDADRARVDTPMQKFTKSVLSTLTQRERLVLDARFGADSFAKAEDDPVQKFTKSDPETFAKAEAAFVVKHLEDFIKAVVTDMTSQDVGDSLRLTRERETMRTLIAMIGRAK